MHVTDEYAVKTYGGVKVYFHGFLPLTLKWR